MYRWVKESLAVHGVIAFFFLLSLCSFEIKKEQTIVLVVSSTAHVRIKYGAEKLAAVLQVYGYKTIISNKNSFPDKEAILITQTGDDVYKKLPDLSIKTPVGREGFAISSLQKNIVVAGFDETGVLYGCLELIDRVKKEKGLPKQVSFSDAPEMVLRGTCIGLQKTTYLPGRAVYEYPYTPESFPWFYDKNLWIQYLDSMMANRYNSLYLWNGHPFASLVRLKDYPYAVEVDDETFKKNEEIFKFLTTEADKRGIWIIQMFYNIIVSKPFAEKNGLTTQDRSRPIVPVIADYTRKSIAAFVEKYPNVGLLITLGEALEGDEREVEWFTKTIIPGVQDGLKALGQKQEPPIVLRGHDTHPQLVMKAALPLYKNLYTMNKYNGEALTTYEPRGSWAQMHREMSSLGSVHIDNVHILANLEPFRYGATRFIQKSVQAMHKFHGANGLHLYPESSYWDWPYSADKADKRLLQIQRDWLWYKAWARYAWKADRDSLEETNYWADLLSQEFAVDRQSGASVLNAYEEAGEIAPKLLRRFGITNGNRQTLMLGMTMSQLINPFKYRVWPELYSSDGPEGEMLIDYAEKEWKGEKHKGETPVQIINEVVRHGDKAVEAVDKASVYIKKSEVEFRRIKNDIYAYRALAHFFSEKVKAAQWVLRYKYSSDLHDLEKALPYLEKSVQYYKELANLTNTTYLYANSMQTGQRKIPVGGDGGKNKTWMELLPYYEKELTQLKHHIDSLRSTSSVKEKKIVAVLKNEEVRFFTPVKSFYTIEKGQKIFTDSLDYIIELAPELEGLKAIRLSKKEQQERGTTIGFVNKTPVKLIVGYFHTKDKNYLQLSNLETDASANNYGQAEVKISNALHIEGLPGVNLHTFSFKPGQNELKLGKGVVLILGFISDGKDLKIYDAGLGIEKKDKDLDWLFN